MAYNPFDDVINQDPAYMAEGGGTGTTDQKPNILQSALKPVQKVGEFFEPGLMYAGEAMMNAPYQFGKLLDTDKTTKERYQETMQDPKSFTQGLKTFMIPVEAVGEALTFLFNPQDIRETRLKLASGEAEPVERIAAQVGATFELLGAGELFKIIGRKFGPDIVNSLQKQNLQSPQEIINALPVSGKEKVEFAKEVYGGMGLPSKPPGMETSQIMSKADTGDYSGSVKFHKGFDEKLKKFEELANVMKQNKPEDKNLTLIQLAEKYGITGVKQGGRNELLDSARRYLKANVPDLYKEKTTGLSKKIGTQYQEENIKQFENWMDRQIESGNTYDSKQEILNVLEELKQSGAIPISTRKTIDGYIANDENLRKKFESIYSKDPSKQEQQQQFINIFNANVDEPKIREFLGKKRLEDGSIVDDIPMGIRNVDDKVFDDIARLADEMNLERIRPNQLFKKFMYDKYRSVKESGVLDIANEEDFLRNVKYSDKDLADLRDEFQAYAVLERDRLYMQNEGFKFLNDLAKNPKFRPYLVVKNSKGEDVLDQQAFRVNKLHDVPLFQARVAGQDRLKKTGRFLNVGTDPEFLNPHFQPYNRLMVDLDPTINLLSDVLNEKGLQDVASKMDAKVIKKVVGKDGKLETPKDRVNFITEGIVKLINARGFNLDPKGKTQLQFLNEVANAIDTIYKDRGLRAIVPTQDQAKLTNMVFGVENPKTIPLDEKINKYKEAFVDNLLYAIENNISPKEFRSRPKSKFFKDKKTKEPILDEQGQPLEKSGAIKGLKKGGPVRMAMGGDPLENLNQQQFTPDPAIDDDFFAKAVQDENLYAFNPMNLFKSFKKVPAMFTPDKNKTLMDITPDATTGLPVVQRTELNDFPFQSHFIQTLSEKGIPNADTTKGWKNLFTGTKGFSQSELKDAGIFDYLDDADKFIPGAKITKEDLLRVYENSPIANIEIKVKDKSPLPDTLPISGEYKDYMGGPKHEGMGSAQIDEGGTDYRNIIINVKKLPGEKKPFFNASHYEKDPNVLAFTRVANYKNANGQDVAVIQELQTDLLTNLKKEQERLDATMKIVRRQKNALKEQIQNYPASADYYQQELDKLEMQYPESKIKFLEETNLVRPTDPVFAEKLAPELTKDLNDIQEQINNLTKANLKEVVDPEYVNKIVALQNEGREKFNRLYELNRQANYDLMLENVDVVEARTSDEIARAGENQSYIPRNNPVQTFPNIPFNKGPDWIDMMLKATIQDAQSRGINKVAIMPSDIINMRWNKDPDSQAGEKFKTIYDKISVQELKNIAKKYTGNKNNLQIEQIVDPTKTDKGLTFLNKSPDGEFQVLKQLEVKKQTPINERDDYYDEEIARIVRSFEDKSVVYSREIAPGQTMDYYVLPTTKGNAETGKVFGYRFEPLGDGDNVDDALLKIEEYNPSLKNMYTITLPEETTKKGPMFLFRKKDGGKIDTDGLVSITDIYGDY